jgi:hypothetical protein
MFYIRAFSWNIFRRKAIYIIAFLVLIFLMIFIHTSNWSEAAVFRVLNEEVVLVIAPSTPSRLFINKEEIPERRMVDNKTPYIFKINTDENIHIRVEPVGSELPLERDLKFIDGKLSIPENQDFWGNLNINEWPNQVFEILLNPTNLANIGKEDKTSIISEESVDFDNKNSFERLRIIQQGENYFMRINDSPMIILKNYQDDEFIWTIRDVNEDNIKEVIIKGSLGQTHKYVEIYQYRNERMERLFWEHGESIEVFPNGNIKIEKRLYDTVDHYDKIKYQWQENKYIKIEETISWWQDSPRWPLTPNKTIGAFFEAYELGLEEEAMNYLVKELQNTRGLKAIINSVEKEWTSIAPPIYYFLGGFGEEGKINRAFYYNSNIHPNYNIVHIYDFELEKQHNKQGYWKIKKVN